MLYFIDKTFVIWQTFSVELLISGHLNHTAESLQLWFRIENMDQELDLCIALEMNK